MIALAPEGVSLHFHRMTERGAGGSLDTTNIKDPVVGFVLNNKGLMYNLTLEGSKITKLDK